LKTINILALSISILIISCNWAKDKAKDTVHKSGEIVSEAGSEFADGVAKGVKETFKNEVKLSEDLKTKGIKTGKISFHSSDSTTDNILTVYVIFENDFNHDITIKVFDEQGLEYGRTTENIFGKKGEAKYFDFIFDKRTDIDGKGKITIE
jgi:hypothetical protein